TQASAISSDQRNSLLGLPLPHISTDTFPTGSQNTPYFLRMASLASFGEDPEIFSMGSRSKSLSMLSQSPSSKALPKWIFRIRAGSTCDFSKSKLSLGP